MLPTLSRITHRIGRHLSVAMPSSCALCGSGANSALCDGCHSQFFSRHADRCAQCAIALPFQPEKTRVVCGDCLNRTPAFDATVAAIDYAAPVDQLVQSLKFGGKLALAPLFAQLLHDAWLRTSADDADLPSLLIAVPLGAQRLAERGFNQAHEIARPLSRSLGIPLLARLAVRGRETAAQAMLPPKDRRKNIRGAFTVAPEAINRIRGAHIGIVDDVMTTGETLGELAATLKRFGAVRISNLVLARAPH